MIALAAVAYAKPGFYYHTGYPYAHVAYTHPVTYTAPVTYTVPVAANTCHNEAGQLVPCAHPAGGVVGNAIHAYNDSPLVPTVAVAGAPVAPAAEAAPAAEGEGVVDVKKREAEAAPEADADAEGQNRPTQIGTGRRLQCFDRKVFRESHVTCITQKALVLL